MVRALAISDWIRALIYFLIIRPHLHQNLPGSMFGWLCPHNVLLGDLLVFNAGPPRAAPLIQAKTFASGTGRLGFLGRACLIQAIRHLA
jgi:hypothetical protein